MISIDRVSFGYGEAQETLSQVSAAIAPGECVLLCGASGCGKTTVTKLINGLIPAFTPGCRLEGRQPGVKAGIRPLISFVTVVFPQPEAPHSRTHSPGAMTVLTWESVSCVSP